MRTELYAEALVEQLRAVEAAGATDRAEEVHAELSRIGPELPKAIAKAESDIKGAIKLDVGVDPEVLDRIAEVRRLRQLEADLQELGYYGAAGRKRTAKAAGPPEKTSA